MNRKIKGARSFYKSKTVASVLIGVGPGSGSLIHFFDLFMFQSYNLDYILYHRYNDPRLSTNCTTSSFLKSLRKVDDIWFPNLGLINCHSSKEVKNSEKVTIAPNGDVFAHKR